MPSPSPFSAENSKLQTTWDSTSLGWFKTCPRLYQYQMIEGWFPRKMAQTLRFGILYHKLHEEYDKALISGHDQDSAIRKAISDVLPEAWDSRPGFQCGHCGRERVEDSEYCPWCTEEGLPQPTKIYSPGLGLDPRRTSETLIRTFLWHVWEYENRRPPIYELASGPALELTFKFPLAENTYGEEIFIGGHLDRAEIIDGEPWVVDHKTTTMSLNRQYFDQWSPHNQMTLYTFAGQVIFKIPSKGTVIDAASVGQFSSTFQRGHVHRTPAQIDEWLSGLSELFVLAERYAEQNFYPMNEESCGKYGGCPFRSICSKDPSVREDFLRGDFIKKAWNPLEAR